MTNEHHRESLRFLGRDILVVAYDDGSWLAVLARSSLPKHRVRGQSRDEALRKLKEAIATPEAVNSFRQVVSMQHDQHLIDARVPPPFGELALAERVSQQLANCWSCSSELHSEVTFVCTSCNWMTCSSCGACGCAHPKYRQALGHGDAWSGLANTYWVGRLLSTGESVVYKLGTVDRDRDSVDLYLLEDSVFPTVVKRIACRASEVRKDLESIDGLEKGRVLQIFDRWLRGTTGDST